MCCRAPAITVQVICIMNDNEINIIWKAIPTFKINGMGALRKSHWYILQQYHAMFVQQQPKSYFA